MRHLCQFDQRSAAGFSIADDDKAAECVLAGADSFVAVTGWVERAREAFNDFQPVIVERHLAVADVLAVLEDTFPRMALLSGSGSAVFAVYQDEGAAAAARRAATARGWHAELTATLASFPRPAEVARRS